MSDNLTYRFDELMATVNLLPDLEENEEGGFREPEDSNWVFPNLTADLATGQMASAIMCQSMKGNEEFRFKICALLTNSAMTRIMDTHEPNEDDLTAIALSANILWATGVGIAMFQTLGLLGSIASRFDVELPALAFAPLMPNATVETFGEKFDPYEILADKLTPADILRVTREKRKD